MCGIAGIVEIGNQPVEPDLLLAMGQAIAHRGPDDEGYVLIDPFTSRCRNYSGPTSPSEIKDRLPMLSPADALEGATIGVCQRRFSIIDLSGAGHQPFFDQQGSCCVVLNGEIYNYLELREELERSGSRFYSQSDTEVLLEAYKHWGTECFSRLNGFWAIALYDFGKKRLILSRDRIGKKPLYWTKLGSRIYFASEIKALLQIPEIYRRRRVNEKAIFYWLTYGRKDLDFSTCFGDVHSLPSACWAVLDKDFPNNIRTFWSVPAERLSERDISAAEAARTLRTLLQDSIRIRLRADVPLSIELSGGMDSSTLVALAAQVYPGKITTYTVRFPDKQINEEPYARSVAHRFNTDYHVLESPTANFWSQILRFTYLEEEPYGSPNLQTSQVIWAQMRSRGTKVSLHGAGGDENFAGYGGYYMQAQMQNLAEGRLGTYLSNALRYSSARTRVRTLWGPILGLVKHRCGPKMQWLGMSTRVTYLNKNDSFELMHEPGTLSEALRSDMTNTLMPYWLRSGDRGYMGVPLEVRAPFLDYRVIEFAFRLPTTYLIRDGWHKWILRKAVEDLLPKDVLWRRQKLGFPFPFARFYSENEEILGIILNNSQNPYIDFSKRSRFRNDWKTLSFILWYELFFNENVELFEKVEAMAQRMRPIEDYGFVPQFLNSRRVTAYNN